MHDVLLSYVFRYQALLQKNLMYLAAIADAQPPPPTPGAAPAQAMASQVGCVDKKVASDQ